MIWRIHLSPMSVHYLRNSLRLVSLLCVFDISSESNYFIRSYSVDCKNEDDFADKQPWKVMKALFPVKPFSWVYKV